MRLRSFTNVEASLGDIWLGIHGATVVVDWAGRYQVIAQGWTPARRNGKLVIVDYASMIVGLVSAALFGEALKYFQHRSIYTRIAPRIHGNSKGCSETKISS